MSLVEVFIKTQTRADGTYVDRKAEKIASPYEKKVQEKLSGLVVETSDVSDSASRPRELTTDDYTSIFLPVNPLRMIHENSLWSCKPEGDSSQWQAQATSRLFIVCGTA